MVVLGRQSAEEEMVLEGHGRWKRGEAKPKASVFHKTIVYKVRFQVLAAVSMKMTVFIFCIMQSSDSTAQPYLSSLLNFYYIW
jgi:hypothetical protein